MRASLQVSVVLVVSLWGCAPALNTERKDAGTDVPPPPKPAPFNVEALEDNASGLLSLSMAVGPNDKVGVAYLHNVDGTDLEVRYVEWQGGVAKPSERIATVQRHQGLSLAFQPNGQPAVAYLGGDDDGGNNPYWFQTDAVIATRNSDGSWTETVVANTGGEAVAGNPVSDRGFLVGLSPALAYAGTEALLAYRDAHDGQFGVQDYAGSDLEFAKGAGSSFAKSVVIAGGNNKKGFGFQSQMVVVGTQPALVSSLSPMSAEGPGKDVLFVKQNANGGWTSPVTAMEVGNVQTGAAFAYDSTLGYAFAVLDRSTDTLNFTSSVDGATWSFPDPLYAFGTGGFWPALAIDPLRHEPTVVYYVCSNRVGVAEGACDSADDSLRIATRVEGTWQHGLVDEDGAYLPKVGYLGTGQRVIVYRTVTTGALKLALER